MKLKKIASLALAGIMAVSMLAGCKDGKRQQRLFQREYQYHFWLLCCWLRLKVCI